MRQGGPPGLRITGVFELAARRRPDTGPTPEWSPGIPTERDDIWHTQAVIDSADGLLR
jgi:hypothetical protein